MRMFGGNGFTGDEPTTRTMWRCPFSDSLLLRHTSLHNFHERSFRLTFFYEYYFAHDMRMCGNVAYRPLRKRKRKKCQKREEWKRNTDFNEKGPIDFNGEPNYAATTAPHTHTPTRTSQTHCTLSEDNFEVNKRNKFVPSPSNKILWNWLLRTREPTVWDGEGERKRELSKKDVSTYVVARKWMHSKVYSRSVSAFFSNSFVR